MEAETKQTNAKHVVVLEKGRMIAGGLVMDEEEIQEVLSLIPPAFLSEIAQESGRDPKVRYCLDCTLEEYLDEVSVLVVFENSGTMIRIFDDEDNEEEAVLKIGLVEMEKDSLRFAEISESSLIE